MVGTLPRSLKIVGETGRRSLRVSVKFVNDMVILKRETGELEPRAQGNGGGHGKLGRLRYWIKGRMEAKPDLTLDDLVLEIGPRSRGVLARGPCFSACRADLSCRFCSVSAWISVTRMTVALEDGGLRQG